MSTVRVAESLNGLLEVHGFKRRQLRWVRDTGSLFDVIDIQVGDVDASFTINLGVLDKEVSQICWGKELSPFPLEVECTARARIGFLLEARRDKWWSIDDEDAAFDVVQVIKEEGLPFLERMHSREAIAVFLQGSMRRHEPPPNRMYLAILTSKLGDPKVGCGRLEQILRDVPDFAEEIRGAMRRLGCG